MVMPAGQTYKSPLLEVFDFGKRYASYYAAGVCSVPVTQQMKKMGLEPVSHIGGGFSEWKYSGAPIEEVEKR
jgi:rhodanese-related sulfurtransferase